MIIRAFCCFLVCSVVVVDVVRGPVANTMPRPNVFLITIDTLRADHVHSYGYGPIKTPSLDNLAKEGIRFAQAFTPSPITNASHTSILTGLLPSSHGVSDFGVPLKGSHATLAGELKKQGYGTAAFIGAVVLDSKLLAPGLDRGFQFYDNFPEYAEGKSRWGRIERRGMDVAQRAEKWLSTQRAGPYFVWMHLYDPHDPYEPPAPYSEEYKGRLYDGEIAYADSALGNFIDFLKEKNLYRNSLIVVVGDHGEGLGEHKEDTHGIFLYDSTTHVPLIMKLANGREAGKEVQAQIRTIDIMPTILDLLTVSAPEKLDGASLGPLLAGTETDSRIALGETEYPLRFGWAPLRSIRSDGLKFIEAPLPELYDLNQDAGELRNTYVPWDTRVQKLRRSLTDSIPPLRRGEKAPASVSTLDELHALGYLGPADAASSTDVPEPSLLPDPKDKVEEQNLLHVAMMSTEDGRVPEARAALKKLLAMDSTSVTALSQLGRLEMTSGSSSEAAGYLRRAYELRPQDPTIALEYSDALELNGDLEKAREVLETSLKFRADQFSTRLRLGRIYLRLNDAKFAIVQFEAAQLMEPGNVEVTVDLAKALIAQGNLTDAVELLQEAANSSMKNPEVPPLLAKVCTKFAQQTEVTGADGRVRAICKSQKSP
jgi:arylsulfatase A-like enzyme/cytochrome c-type biogenesis protein CcmH/NrfG